jgi:DNA-binding response OmpR family regulator
MSKPQLSTPQLLLVEDDAAVAEVVAFHLRGAGYDVEHAADGHQALRRIESQRWDLVLLDVMLPGADGFEICRRLRAPSAQRPAGTGDHVPIIMLSARTAEAERVLGLELGADDYLAKPFSMLELTARVRALLRRVHQLRDQLQVQAASPVLQAGSLQLDVARRSVFLAGQPLALTLREFDLLHFLARHPGQIFSRSELLQRVWGDGFDGFEHTVNSHINRLRSKLEGEGTAQGAEAQPVRAAVALTAPAAPAVPARLIETVWGLGYRFNAPGQQAAPARSGSAWGAARQGAVA